MCLHGQHVLSTVVVLCAVVPRTTFSAVFSARMRHTDGVFSRRWPVPSDNGPERTVRATVRKAVQINDDAMVNYFAGLADIESSHADPAGDERGDQSGPRRHLE